jgi:hypothetical protein
MKGMLLGIAVLLLLVFTATDSQAQCVKCGNDFFSGCASCVPTNYNASVLCELTGIGFVACEAKGQCDGYWGQDTCAGSTKSGCVVQLAEDSRGPHLPYRSGEWKLVSVTLKRGPDGRSSL